MNMNQILDHGLPGGPAATQAGLPVPAPFSLTLARMPALIENLYQASCILCDGSLDLHQPDPGLPDRLLGTCAKCQRWYILELAPGDDEAVIVQIPEVRQFLKHGGELNGHADR